MMRLAALAIFALAAPAAEAREPDAVRAAVETVMGTLPSRAALPPLAVETLDGTEEIEISPGTATGDSVRFKGRGVPHLRGRGRGDLLVRLVVDTPSDLDDEQRALLVRLAELRGEHLDPPEHGLLARLRDAFTRS